MLTINTISVDNTAPQQQYKPYAYNKANKPCHRTGFIALDLSMTFDTVNYAILFEDGEGITLLPI